MGRAGAPRAGRGAERVEGVGGRCWAGCRDPPTATTATTAFGKRAAAAARASRARGSDGTHGMANVEHAGVAGQAKVGVGAQAGREGHQGRGGGDVDGGLAVTGAAPAALGVIAGPVQAGLDVVVGAGALQGRGGEGAHVGGCTGQARVGGRRGTGVGAKKEAAGGGPGLPALCCRPVGCRSAGRAAEEG